MAVYFGGVATLQALFRALTGQQSTFSVVASTLLIAALFNPSRGHTRAFIDRRFYRKKYVATKTLEAFSARLREETDLRALNGELTRVMTETMQPATSLCGCAPTHRREEANGESTSPGPTLRLSLRRCCGPCSASSGSSGRGLAARRRVRAGGHGASLSAYSAKGLEGRCSWTSSGSQMLIDR